jgi:hypothetical protein
VYINVNDIHNLSICIQSFIEVPSVMMSYGDSFHRDKSETRNKKRDLAAAAAAERADPDFT